MITPELCLVFIVIVVEPSIATYLTSVGVISHSGHISASNMQIIPEAQSTFQEKAQTLNSLYSPKHGITGL